VTPNHLCRLPGFPYGDSDPHGFILRDQIVDYVERFAANFDPLIRGNVEVEHISACDKPGRYRLVTSIGEFRADNLIIAVGTHQHPNIPSLDQQFSAEITRLHTRDYRNSAQLQEGAVLVIGSGQSGCQVAEDLIGVGREVHLCVGNAGRIPRRYRERDILDWDVLTGDMDMPIDQHPKGEAIRFKVHSHLTGRDGGHTIDLRKLAQDGVHLHSKVLDVEGTVVQLAGNLMEALDAADEGCKEKTDGIDAFIDKHGLDELEETIVPVNWQPIEEPATFDLARAGITTVIYAIGFHFDFNWIDLPIFDTRGYPRYQSGVTELPGLYFVGLHWMHTQGSGLFYGVGKDAEYVVRHLTDDGNY
jgi:putative flavoprotein involved in K+ transport